jgi:colanic acid biosynthesis glycosyl transferase WcaI
VRLTLINQFYAPDISPTAQLAASLAEHRAERGDRVTIVAGRAGYLEGLVGADGGKSSSSIQVHRVWTPDLGKSSRARRLLGYATFSLGGLWQLARLPRQDVIVAMTTPPFVVLAALLHQQLHRQTRVVLWSMDCYPDAAERFGELQPGGPVSRALRAVNRWAFRRVEVVVGLDAAMVDLLESQYSAGPDRPRFVVIPNWERLSLFPSDAAPAGWAGFDELPIGDRTVVLYLGNTGVGHRFDTVLAAAAQLTDEAVFLFVGGGERWGALEAEASALGLTNVVFRTYVPKEETPAVMAGADLALITLHDDALGVMSPSKLHANLAAGLPVLYIGPEGSNVDESITRFGAGRSLREGDTTGVVQAVRQLCTDPTARTRAREAFEAAYCDAATLPAFDRLLEG